MSATEPALPGGPLDAALRDGRRQRLRPGDVMGELSAIDGGEHSTTVSVVEEGEAMVVPAERFLAALETTPGLALVLLRSIVGRLRDADRMRALATGSGQAPGTAGRASTSAGVRRAPPRSPARSRITSGAIRGRNRVLGPNRSRQTPPTVAPITNQDQAPRIGIALGRVATECPRRAPAMMPSTHCQALRR
ncbi:MAG: hypothetical protein MUQ32_05960 [Chloroflexi bacterium]|nr:hypothetical protein [Chloroflexota bacterium]